MSNYATTLKHHSESLACPIRGCKLPRGSHGVIHAKDQESYEAERDTWRDYRPTMSKIEWNITYSCDLECVACNRGSFLRKPHTPNMTIADAEDVMRQADRIGFDPYVTIIIGGEPTLHPDFTEFCRMARARTGKEVWVISNRTTQRARDLADEMSAKYSISIVADGAKAGSVTADGADDFSQPWWLDMFVSPSDCGMPLREPCFAHSSTVCGISVDSVGYTPCALGGAVDALLGLGKRTKDLADIFDAEKSRDITRALCKHCGINFVHRDTRADHVGACDRVLNTPMSKTWIEAFKDRT